MVKKSLGLAAIALGCSMGIAVAQAPSPPTPSPSHMQVLKALAAQHAATTTTPGAAATGSKANLTNLTAKIPLGWNTAHATNCGWFVDSGGGQWFYILPSEGGIIFEINNSNISQGLQVPCGEGYFISWFVTDSDTGAYNQTFSYSFK
ncbi:MAG: hypothetical protein DLM68_08640 [Hyphomicrobiales bacterium]|nr:MAG: hypothetical protein DLM68_08640 [Hyphomicrobiales bacterium]